MLTEAVAPNRLSSFAELEGRRRDVPCAHAEPERNLHRNSADTQQSGVAPRSIGKPPEKSPFKKLTESASASALFLGLVLTFVSLHDAFISKPAADRISRLSQFNQAVNAAAKARQELATLQMQTADPQLRLAVASIVTPQILNIPLP